MTMLMRISFDLLAYLGIVPVCYSSTVASITDNQSITLLQELSPDSSFRKSLISFGVILFRDLSKLLQNPHFLLQELSPDSSSDYLNSCPPTALFRFYSEIKTKILLLKRFNCLILSFINLCSPTCSSSRGYYLYSLVV